MNQGKGRNSFKETAADTFLNEKQDGVGGAYSEVDASDLAGLLPEFDLEDGIDAADSETGYLFQEDVQERFKLVFCDNFASLCVFAQQFLGDEELAKDAVHDAFVRLWERPELFLKANSIRLYLYSVVRNRCVDIIRKGKLGDKYIKSVELEQLKSDEHFELEVVREEVYRMLDSAIEQLPERSRAVLRLKMQGLKNHEIAQCLGVSVNTVNTLKTNAYRTIRTLLENVSGISDYVWLILFLR